MPSEVEQCNRLLVEPPGEVGQLVDERSPVEVLAIEHLETQPFEGTLDRAGVVAGIGELRVRSEVRVLVIADDKGNAAAGNQRRSRCRRLRAFPRRTFRDGTA